LVEEEVIDLPVEVVSREPDWSGGKSKPIFITSHRGRSSFFFSWLVVKRLERYGEAILKAKGRSNLYRMLWILLNLGFRINRDIKVKSFKIWLEKATNPYLHEGNPLRSVLCAELRLKKINHRRLKRPTERGCPPSPSDGEPRHRVPP